MLDSSAIGIQREWGRIVDHPAVHELTLWVMTTSGQRKCLISVPEKPSRGVQEAARKALRGWATPPGSRRTIMAIPVGGSGALAARVKAGAAAEILQVFSQVEAAMGAALERLARDELRRTQEDDALAAAERRSVRLGLDLHDGPAQQALALLADLRLFARQLASELADHPHRGLLTGRAQDLEARTMALESSIRELARSAGGPAALNGEVAPAIRAEAKAFADATGVVPEVITRGPLDDATPSQRIALLRGIQEALRNVREHARPSRVRIEAQATPGRLEATVADDGAGFDVARALERSRRGGRLGLSGIDARARLLGGSCSIESRPGGPTAVTITLPRWSRDELDAPADPG